MTEPNETMLYERIIDNAWAYNTAQALFRETCVLKADKIAIHYKDETITYKEFQVRVDQLTQALMDMGVGKGDVVGMLPSPTPEHAAVWFAALQAGAIINPLNLLWDREALAAIMKRNKIKVVFTVGQYNKVDYIERLLQCYGETDDNTAVTCPRPEIVIVSEDTGVVPDELPTGFVRLSEWQAKPEAINVAAIEERVASVDWSEIQYICMSSGSTGLPKSGLWNHRSPLSTSHFLAVNLGIKATYRWMNMSPFFHNSGMTFEILMGLCYAGLETYLDERFDPENAANLIQDNGIEATFGFGANVMALHGAKSYNHEKFQVKSFFYAGLPKMWSIVRGLVQPNTRIMGLYAQTENGPAVTFHEPGNINEDSRWWNHGRPLGGVEMQIRDVDTGEVLREGEGGQIWYKSPYLFQGYLQEDGSIELPLDEDGFFASGDYGVMKHGFLTWMERMGGVVKSGGENVVLARVTDNMLELFKDDFGAMVAVAVPDDYWGDRVVAVGLQPKNPGAISDEEFRARCKERLSNYEIPRNLVEFPGPMPWTPEGKQDFKTLKNFAIENVDTSVR
ncbi:MAG: acyl--CoA ligase [Propionibacteriaceae bacterium]|nr:acyl--CoA ligase [Propionibacteriaceae bacterium]